MAHLQLAPVAAAVPAPVLLAKPDPASRHSNLIAAACTADGLLRLLPLQGNTDTSHSSSKCAGFVVQLINPGQPPQQLSLPYATLEVLPDGGGMLFAQQGSGRLLFCQSPAALQPEQATDVWELGSHASPVCSFTASPCGGQALSGDVQGGMKLWSLADGTQLAHVPGSEDGRGIAASCWLKGPSSPASASASAAVVATARAKSSVVRLWGTTPGAELQLVGELDVGADRNVTVLEVAAGKRLLAVGCSDGRTLLWRYAGGEFSQHARLPGPGMGLSVPAAVEAVSLSEDGSLVAIATAAGTAGIAGAAGSPGAAGTADAAGAEVSLFQTDTGKLLCSRALPAPPVLLLLGGGVCRRDFGNAALLVLMVDGSTLTVHVPEAGFTPQATQGATAAREQALEVRGRGQQRGGKEHDREEQQQQQDQQPLPNAQAVGSCRKQKKSVRFADYEAAHWAGLVPCGTAPSQAGRPAVAGRAAEPEGRHWVPQPTTECSGPSAARQQPILPRSSSSSSLWAAAGASRPSLPPLPIHPLLRGGSRKGSGTAEPAMPAEQHAAIAACDGLGPPNSSTPLASSPHKGRGSAAGFAGSTGAKAGTSARITSDACRGSGSRSRSGGGSSSDQRRPLYPILDLRALRGLNAAGAACMDGPKDGPLPPRPRAIPMAVAGSQFPLPVSRPLDPASLRPSSASQAPQSASQPLVPAGRQPFHSGQQLPCPSQQLAPATQPPSCASQAVTCEPANLIDPAEAVQAEQAADSAASSGNGSAAAEMQEVPAGCKCPSGEEGPRQQAPAPLQSQQVEQQQQEEQKQGQQQQQQQLHQEQQHSKQVLPPCPSRVSKQRCGACNTLAAAAGRDSRQSCQSGASDAERGNNSGLHTGRDSRGGGSGSGRPSSPSKAALLAELAVLANKAAAGKGLGVQLVTTQSNSSSLLPPNSGSGNPLAACPSCRGRPGSPSPMNLGTTSVSPSSPGSPSPLKLGVACTLEEQQRGEEELPEVRPFTVVEHQPSLAHSELRQQRYARLYRRCMASPAKHAQHTQALAQQQAQAQAACELQQGRGQAAAVLREQQAEAWMGVGPVAGQMPLVQAASGNGPDAGACACAAPGGSVGQMAAAAPAAAVPAPAAASAPAAAAAPAAAPAAVASGAARGGIRARMVEAVDTSTAEEASGAFAIGSDYELSDTEGEEGKKHAGGKGEQAELSMSGTSSSAVSTERTAGSAGSLPDTAAVRSRLGSCVTAGALAVGQGQKGGQIKGRESQQGRQGLQQEQTGEHSQQGQQGLVGAAFVRTSGSTLQLSEVSARLHQLDAALSTLSHKAQRAAAAGAAAAAAAITETQQSEPPMLGRSTEPHQQPGTFAVAGRVQALTEAAVVAAPASAAREAPTAVQTAVPTVVPTEVPAAVAAELAVPAPNSSLMAMQYRQRLLEKKVAVAARSTPPESEVLAARRAAATAATTLARHARLYADLPPAKSAPEGAGERAEAPAAGRHGSSGTGNSNGGGTALRGTGGTAPSPRKAAVPAAAKKKLDERWVAEQRDLRPELTQLWTPPAERVRQQLLGQDKQKQERRHGGVAAVLPPELMPPLPDGRQLLAQFLGIRL